MCRLLSVSATVLLLMLAMGCADAAVGPYEFVPCATLHSLKAIGVAAEDLDREPEVHGGSAISYAYPEIAGRAGVEGDVTIRFFLDERGAVHHAQVVRGIGAGCDEQAVRLVRSSHYAPALRAGRPTSTSAEAVVRFSLACRQAV